MITSAKFGHMAALITTKASKWSFEIASGLSSGLYVAAEPMPDDPVRRFLEEIRTCCDWLEEEHRAAHKEAATLAELRAVPTDMPHDEMRECEEGR